MPEIRNIKTVPVLRSEDLTEDERKEFDWIDSSETLTCDDAEFFRYSDSVYCLSDFERTSGDLARDGWDGQHVDSFFSAIVVKYVDDDYEELQVGLYLS